MKSILIVYNTLSIGGSTTSLLSLLNELDTKKYKVDLLLRDKGTYDFMIPQSVNVLPYLISSDKKKALTLRKLFSLTSIFSMVKGIFWNKIMKYPNYRTQIMSIDTLRYCQPITTKYDVAISFIECLPLYYTMSSVLADKYISWIHVDYKGAKMNARIDDKFLNKSDKIVLVSEYCKQTFDELFPKYSNKSIVVENLLSDKFVKKRSVEYVEMHLPLFNKNNINFVSVCRIVFSHKGLDRGVNALALLKKEGLLKESFRWYIIGDGLDSDKLANMIENGGLSNHVFMCGAFGNPLPLVRECDVFFLPSRYEGKPMAVTEAQMLGLVPVVTEYASAKEQINNGKDGIILPNIDVEVYNFFRLLMLDGVDFVFMKDRVVNRTYSNLDEYKKIERLIDE
ncbi:glycosyltransferase [Xylanibacter muris]|uniref:Glycosyltransferase n=1 Tax=Xylanibacter muris TaxID=2736290 RepID=A0ABX2ANJ8_9BACT|nr:glycosyltransferase [Xylanibacter muris]NPD92798.1 glycosyltransferase [Xylanibacter muris]